MTNVVVLGHFRSERRPPRVIAVLLRVLFLMPFFPATGHAFSVLAHQAIVDQAWESSIVPLLRHRFPNATEQDISDARAYAHGGSHLPDLGYFPLGNRLFTDILHYVCMGDFVNHLI